LIWQLIRKDILRRVKNPGGFLILVAMPLIFVLLMGLIFIRSNSDEIMPRVKLLIEDHDDTFASQFIAGAFGRGELTDMFETEQVEKDQGRSVIDAGKASALLIIPAGFGDSLLHQKRVTLTLVKNPSEAYAPKIAEETVSIMAEGGDRLIRIASKPLKTIQKQIDSDQEMPEVLMASLAVQIQRLIQKIQTYIFPPLITLEEKSISKEEKSGSTASQIYTMLLSGIVLMSLLFILELLARDIFIEKENHTLYRLLTSPAGIRGFVLSKQIFLFIVGMTALCLAWFIGVLLFGIEIPAKQIVPFLIFSMVIIACFTGVISIIYALVKTRTQGQEIAPALIIFTSMLGGSMIPLNSLPGFMKKLAVISPSYWGNIGTQKILLEQASLSQLSTHLLTLGTIAVTLTLLSFWLYQRKFRI
jgi:ABC-2 type transport system permease protein